MGSITEKGLLDRAFRDPTTVERTVGEVMDRPLPIVDIGASLDEAFALLSGDASARHRHERRTPRRGRDEARPPRVPGPPPTRCLNRSGLVTERLVLTPFDQGRDWPAFVADLVLDPVVTRYWADFADPPSPMRDKERLAAEEFLPWFDDGPAARTRGLGAPDAGRRVRGRQRPDDPGPPVGGADPEFGCMLGTRWHGRGLATEAGRAVLDDAWSRLGLARVITVMDSPNPASRRLVDKLGFRFEEVVFDDERRPFIRFAVERDAAAS